MYKYTKLHTLHFYLRIFINIIHKPPIFNRMCKSFWDNQKTKKSLSFSKEKFHQFSDECEWRKIACFIALSFTRNLQDGLTRKGTKYFYWLFSLRLTAIFLFAPCVVTFLVTHLSSSVYRIDLIRIFLLSMSWYFFFHPLSKLRQVRR